jgi:diguanylate cyclase (GGDEF)-like protein
MSETPPDGIVPATRALVVDDDHDVANLLKVLLNTRGFSAETCRNGEEALAEIGSGRYDLVFLDVALPGISGLEVLAKISQGNFDVAVILMTAFSSEQVVVDALREGAADYLRKPFTTGELDAVLSRTSARLELRRRNTHLQQQLARYAALMEQQSITDELTGIPNRRAFDQALERLLLAAETAGSRYSLLMIDIDHFKLVNDRYGHAVGDEVLRAVAATLQRRVRITDTVARIGGEEFGVLLPRTDPAGAVSVAETLRAGVKDCGVPSPEGEVHVSISIGVAGSSAGKRIFQEADAALYEAKAAGRDRVVLHP